MNISIITLFPSVFNAFFENSIMKKAVCKKIIDYRIVDLRNYSEDYYKSCDDKPYGGGAGMILKPEPLFKAIRDVKIANAKVIYPSPSGVKFDYKLAEKLKDEENLLFIAGRYEGIDQRVIDKFVDYEISIGDYVLSSGEISTLVIIDAVYRLIDGVIRKESLNFESFSSGLLEHPQYTRPPEIEGMKVPEVLLSGNHKKIEEYKLKKSIEKTLKNRKDLLEKNEMFLKIAENIEKNK